MRPNGYPDIAPHAAPRLRLFGPADGSGEEFERHCAALGLAPSRTGTGVESGAGQADDDAPVLLAGAAEIEALQDGLGPSAAGFLEIGASGLAGVGRRCIETARDGGLALSLTTTAACALPVVELAGLAIRRRFGMTDGETAELMEICLAEAVSNAVIHGNLEIPDHLRATRHGFDSFRRTMHERLDTPRLAARRIEINARRIERGRITLAVSDQGAGFELASLMQREVRADARCGRGLGLIRRACAQMAAEDDGRTLVMTFSVPEPRP
jgi:anti-sigma regulatory factor (Ser/Thr protein kinase)